MYRILILSTAAIAFSGCSFNGGGSHFGQVSNGTFGSNGSYGANCGVHSPVSSCASGSSYSVSSDAPYYGGPASDFAHQSSGHYGENHLARTHESYPASPEVYYEPTYHQAQAQYPSAQSYGTQVQGHPGYSQGPSYGGGQFPQLRGAFGSGGGFPGYKYGTLGVINYDTGTDAYGLQGRVGYQATQFLGGELEGSFGINDDTEALGTGEISSGINHSFAGFARGVVPVTNQINLFGRAGYHYTEIGGTLTDAAGMSITVDDGVDGFAYGAGAEYAFNPRDSLRFDYTRYDVGAGDLESLALAYSRKF